MGVTYALLYVLNFYNAMYKTSLDAIHDTCGNVPTIYYWGALQLRQDPRDVAVVALTRRFQFGIILGEIPVAKNPRNSGIIPEVRAIQRISTRQRWYYYDSFKG